MVWIELRFPVIGTALPSDHGYAMYSAISRLVPEAHQADWLAVETVPGTARGDGGIHINERARLRMRMPRDHLALMLKLAGKRLEVDGYAVRLGVPQTFLLQPSSALYARCVTIKSSWNPNPFLMPFAASSTSWKSKANRRSDRAGRSELAITRLLASG